MIKIPVLLFTCIIMCLVGVNVCAGIHLQTGETIDLSFDSLPFVGIESDLLGKHQIRFSIRYQDDLLVDGEAIEFKLFEESGGGNLIDSFGLIGSWRSDLDSSGKEITYGNPILYSSNNPWFDHNGMIRASMISGSVVIKELLVSVVHNGEHYSKVFPIPEPSGILVYVLAFSTFLSRRSVR